MLYINSSGKSHIRAYTMYDEKVKTAIDGLEVQYVQQTQVKLLTLLVKDLTHLPNLENFRVKLCHQIKTYHLTDNYRDA